jgi:hypothetical protein
VKVFIPESIFMEDNPWDGRTRYGVHTTVEGALKALEDFGSPGDPLVVAKSLPDEGDVILHLVGRQSEAASMSIETGPLYIFEEELQGDDRAQDPSRTL